MLLLFFFFLLIETILCMLMYIRFLFYYKTMYVKRRLLKIVSALNKLND